MLRWILLVAPVLLCAVVATAAEPSVVSDSRPVMSTRMQVLVFTDDEAGAKAAINDAFADVARLSDLISEWNATSEISRINAAAGKSAVKVGSETLDLVLAGKAAAEETHGAFAMTWLALGGLWKIPPPKDQAPRVPAKTDIEKVLPLIGDAAIVVDKDASTVMLPKAGMAIGIGAIGKGYAMGSASPICSRRRASPTCLVSAGGDVVARGSKGTEAVDGRTAGSAWAWLLRHVAVDQSGDLDRWRL